MAKNGGRTKKQEVQYLGRKRNGVRSLSLTLSFSRKKKTARDKKIREAVEKHAYSQEEVAEHLGMHYSTISRLLKETDKTSK